MTTDAGGSWRNIHGNLPAVPVNTIARHPSAPNRLYVGTTIGFFASDNGGVTWSTTNDGPSTVSVMDLFWYENHTLVAATFGRGVWKVDVTPPVDPPRLANISTRMQVLTGENVMIGGFIIGGSVPKTVVVRARGPSMAAQNVPGLLANPVLQLFSGQTQLAVNDNWRDAANAPQIQASGFAPSDDLESAIMTTLAPGPYTAIVTGAGGSTGVGIVEVFEVDQYTTPLINIATRGQVLTGSDVMIGGFIIQGSGPQTVVVRARGPSMAAAGVANPLANPMLQLFSGQTQLAVNDDWQQAANASQIQSSGFAPADTRESAIMMTLDPGAYTAIVTGVGATTGVAIVEVFTAP